MVYKEKRKHNKAIKRVKGNNEDRDERRKVREKEGRQLEKIWIT